MSDDLNKIIATQAVQGEQIESIQESCKEIRVCLLGNGKIGLVTRTDRLEQKEVSRSKLIWIIVTIVCGLLLKAAFPEIMTLMKG